MEETLQKQKLQSVIAFLEVHFVPSEMIVLDNTIIFVYGKKCFIKIFLLE